MTEFSQCLSLSYLSKNLKIEKKFAYPKKTCFKRGKFRQDFKINSQNGTDLEAS